MKKNYLLLLLCLPLLAICQSTNLRVMSYNIRSFEPDFSLLQHIELIGEIQPDVVAFQEVESRTSRMENRDLVLEIAKATGMFPFFAPSYVKDDGQYGNAILSKYPIVEASYIELPILKEKGGSDQRVGLVAKIILPSGLKTNIICIHLDHRLDGNSKYEQLKPTLTSLDGITPAIMLGDFNDSPLSNVIEKVKENFDNQTDEYPTFSGGSKLDYIFSYPKGKWKQVSYRVIYEAKLSDHYPIVCDIQYAQ